MRPPYIVGFGGTTRPGSSGEKLVAAVLKATEAHGAQSKLFGGEFLSALPHYAPEKPERTPEQLAFVEAVRAADGIVIGSPSYHGGISGLVKNALDLLEDTRADARIYFDGCAVGLVVSAAGWQGGGVTLSAMRDMVHAMRGWPTPVGIAVNSVAQSVFGADGTLADESVKAAVEAQALQIVEFARQRTAA
jgi:FMN reductase